MRSLAMLDSILSDLAALDEERLLAKELPGYTEYQRKLRFRLIPGVW